MDYTANPRMITKGQLFRREDGTTEVVRKVSVIVHLADGTDHVVDADEGQVPMTREPEVNTAEEVPQPEEDEPADGV